MGEAKGRGNLLSNYRLGEIAGNTPRDHESIGILGRGRGGGGVVLYSKTVDKFMELG